MKAKILTQKNSKLPKNILQRCEYAAQPLNTMNLAGNYVRSDKKLEEPVTSIRMDYPFEVKNGEYNVYEITPAKNWAELLTETIKVFQREYNAGNNITFHGIDDFIIERVDVHPNNLATILIGS